MKAITTLFSLCLFLAATGCAAGEPGKGKKDEGLKLFPKGPEIEKLKTELSLTDEQVAKAKEAAAVVAKKDAELSAKPEVVAAEAEVKKAHEALHAAEAKLKEVKGNITDEYRNAVLASLPEDKKEKGKHVLKIGKMEKAK